MLALRECSGAKRFDALIAEKSLNRCGLRKRQKCRGTDHKKRCGGFEPNCTEAAYHEVIEFISAQARRAEAYQVGLKWSSISIG